MWNDPVLSTATRIGSPIGTIVTPDMDGGPQDLQYRIGIARNAFRFMHDRLFASSPDAARNQALVRDCFNAEWAVGNARWAEPGTR